MDKNDIKLVIGQRIGELLAQNGILQKDLAKHLGVKPNIISYYFTGERVPNIEMIVKIAQFFNVTTDYLLGLSNVKGHDADFHAISNYTGLSDRAINLLHQEKEIFEKSGKSSCAINATNILLENSADGILESFLNYLEADLIFVPTMKDSSDCLKTDPEVQIDKYKSGTVIPHLTIMKRKEMEINLCNKVLDAHFWESYFFAEIQHALR